MSNGLSIPNWSGRRATKALEHIKATGRRNNTPCCICNQPIDYNLPSTDPNGCSLQHLKSRALYPQLTWDPANWAPAHLHCNQTEGKEATVGIGTTSRKW
ncbi:MAG: HNH endonuclease [Micrococcaceae bacterium]|nr:HNH endonuclease [Micrococcaceae bacterium]